MARVIIRLLAILIQSSHQFIILFILRFVMFHQYTIFHQVIIYLLRHLCALLLPHIQDFILDIIILARQRHMEPFKMN